MNDVDAFDRSVRRAWVQFRSALADHLDAMAPGHSLVLNCPPFGDQPESPCVQFYAWDVDQVRCEALSDEYLPHTRGLTADQAAALTRLQFAPPAVSARDAEAAPDLPSNWFLDRSRSYADQLAAAAVDVLREVWGVPHPAFVRPESPEHADVTPLITRRAPHREAAPTDPFVAVRTRDRDHRRDVLSATLHTLLGFLPDADEDGDFPFRLGPAWIFLCPTYDAPFVQILAPIAVGVQDPARAATVIGDVNRRWPHVKVLLDQDRVVATIDITVVPLVPQQVVDMLALMEKFVTEAAGALVESLEARPYLDEFGDPSTATRDDAGHLPTSLCALAEDVWERGADISVDDVLGHCGHDRRVLEQYIDVAKECELAALDRALPEGDPRAAAAAGLDARIWRVTANLLTSAHRTLVTQTPEQTRPRGSQLDLFGPTELFGPPELFGQPEDTLFD